MPVWVSEGSLVIRAMPKSASLAKPRRSTRTFDGLTSRCTMPAAWAAARASATCSMTWAASSSGIRPCLLTSWVIVLPSTYSITSQWWPLSSSTTRSNTATTWGWLSCAASRASRSARARSVPSAPGSSPICLRATWRPSISSCPSQTAPMPPRPISRSREYLPAITGAFRWTVLLIRAMLGVLARHTHSATRRAGGGVADSTVGRAAAPGRLDGTASRRWRVLRRVGG